LRTGQNLATRKFLLFTNPQQTRRGIAEVIEHLEGFQVRSPIDKEIPGIVQLVEKAEVRIRNGLVAYDALEKLKANRGDDAARASFNASSKDLGYGLLLKQFVEDPRWRTTNRSRTRPSPWAAGALVVLLFPPHGGLRFRAACSVRDLALARGARGGSAALTASGRGRR